MARNCLLQCQYAFNVHVYGTPTYGYIVINGYEDVVENVVSVYNLEQVCGYRYKSEFIVTATHTPLECKWHNIVCSILCIT